MILADKIVNERKRNGWSQEELADMLDVSRQSVSKWESAQSVPDLTKILKLAEIFSVSTDYLLKDEMEPENRMVSYDSEDTGSTLRRVSLAEASEYISLRKRLLPKVGIGVMLCITCPVMLIFLAGLANAGMYVTEGIATAIGLVFLFAHIGIAVFLFITNGTKLSKFDFLEKESFEAEYGVDGMAKERLAENEASNTKALVTGVLMCVLGCVPLVVCSVLGMPAVVTIIMVDVLLLAVAFAVYLFVSVCAVNASYKVLLQSGDYTPEMKKKNAKIEGITTVYWLLVVAIFLIVSFTTGRWDRSWIIWAVSGVLFALVRAVAMAMIKTDDK